MLEEALLSNAKIQKIYGVESHPKSDYTEIISEKELEQISSLKSPNKYFATVEIPEYDEISKNSWSIVLEDINDPGNLGTIIRTALWFGFENVICSENSCDPYQTKVVQSSMGAIFKIPVSKISLESFYSSETREVFTAEMEGEPSGNVSFKKSGVLHMGSESHGVSRQFHRQFKRPITIQKFGDIESLNVATAAAILMSQIKG